MAETPTGIAWLDLPQDTPAEEVHRAYWAWVQERQEEDRRLLALVESAYSTSGKPN